MSLRTNLTTNQKQQIMLPGLEFLEGTPKKIELQCQFCHMELNTYEQSSSPCKSCSLQICYDCYKYLQGKTNHCPKCKTPFSVAHMQQPNNSSFPLMKTEKFFQSREPEPSLGLGLVNLFPNTQRMPFQKNLINLPHPQMKSRMKEPEKLSASLSNGIGISQGHRQQNLLNSVQEAEMVERFRRLSNLRVVQPNLVYVIGLAQEIAHEEILALPQYFGQYGQIVKIVVKRNHIYNPCSPSGPSYSAYVTFTDPLEAAVAIMCIDEYTIDGRTLRASLGTTKYCGYFLKGSKCQTPECLYLHYQHENQVTFMKDDDDINNKMLFKNLKKLAVRTLQQGPETLALKKVENTIFPPATLVWKKLQEFAFEELKMTSSEKNSSDFQYPKESKQMSASNVQDRFELDFDHLSISSMRTSLSAISCLEEVEKQPSKLWGVENLLSEPKLIENDSDSSRSSDGKDLRISKVLSMPATETNCLQTPLKLGRLNSDHCSESTRHTHTTNSLLSAKTPANDLDSKIYSQLVSSFGKGESRFGFAQKIQSAEDEHAITDFNQIIQECQMQPLETDKISGQENFMPKLRSNKKLFTSVSEASTETTTTPEQFKENFPIKELDETQGFQAIMCFLEGNIGKNQANDLAKQPQQSQSSNLSHRKQKISPKPKSNPKKPQKHYGNIVNIHQ